ncbi:L,D-transpeptidase family protein [Ferruginibacter albus]|uniref:L,D-transpeptidase family protein n=1 Tax=Ferruginibacter albus TaxID=2875540 RepID=UPI001CC4C9C1|nr:L,D-transpeptidase [Ferruginibacter albus]UAY51903.1 L,D-transpeptidase [Ferruginibacter albus]
MKNLRLLPLFLLLGCVAFLSFMPVPGAKKRTTSKTVVKDSSDENPYYIVINKSTYELKVYDDEGWYATYPVVFGSKDLGDKMREGDKRTPDGSFKVILKKVNPSWGPELLLNYPNETSVAKFNQRKANGLVPKNAKIGGGIAIHSTRKDEEWTVDNFYNWTDGCISVKYSEMQDLYSYIPVGTPVTIVEK